MGGSAWVWRKGSDGEGNHRVRRGDEWSWSLLDAKLLSRLDAAVGLRDWRVEEA